jgi:hypothetical protein
VSGQANSGCRQDCLPHKLKFRLQLLRQFSSLLAGDSDFASEVEPETALAGIRNLHGPQGCHAKDGGQQTLRQPGRVIDRGDNRFADLLLQGRAKAQSWQRQDENGMLMNVWPDAPRKNLIIADRFGRRCGARAHHFGDKTGMLDGVRRGGFHSARGADGSERYTRPDRDGRAVAVGEGYLDFALRNPGHFRIMFRAELLNKEDEEYQAAGRPAFQVLEDTIRDEDAATGRVDETTLHERCLLAWSVVHGFATLCLEGAIEPPGRSTKIRLQAGVELGGKILRLLGPSLFTRTEIG